MQEEIVAQGVELMLYGMGTVVLFLAVLIVATTAMSAVVGRFFPEPVPAPIASATRTTPVSDVPDAELVAVISAAVHQHRHKHSQRSK